MPPESSTYIDDLLGEDVSPSKRIEESLLRAIVGQKVTSSNVSRLGEIMQTARDHREGARVVQLVKD